MTVGGKIRFFSLRFYIERSFLSSVFTGPYYEVLSTFLTSFPLAKRFAPRQKVCVLPPPLGFSNL